MTDNPEKCVYIICAHSDDQTLGVAGTTAKYAKQGIKVYTIIMSYGEFSHPLMQEKVTTKVRVKEAQAADKVVNGAGVMFLGLKEQNFIKDAKEKRVIPKLKKLLDEKKPLKIFTHSISDPHGDHKETLEFVKMIVRKMDYKPNVYSFSIWNPMTLKKRNSPKLIIDISDTVKLKIKSLLCFKSQKISIYQLLPATLVKNFVAGYKHSMLFAEEFYKVDINDSKKKKKIKFK